MCWMSCLSRCAGCNMHIIECIGTHLLLDETAMLPGQLQEQGIKNVKALGDAIQWQRVHYDFKYHTAEFPCNIVSRFWSFMNCFDL